MSEDDSTIIVNFKTYEAASGVNAVNLALKVQKVAGTYNKDLRIAVSAPDIYRVSEALKESEWAEIPIYAQHIDSVLGESNTGWITAKAVKDAGVMGTLLNHSEKKLDMNILSDSIEQAHKYGLEVVACAATPEMSGDIAGLKNYPDCIAMEPPELIGGEESVTTRPDAVKRTVKYVYDINQDIKVLIGAGVNKGEDVKIAKELGASGVLLASAVTKAPDVEMVLMDLAGIE